MKDLRRDYGSRRLDDPAVPVGADARHVRVEADVEPEPHRVVAQIAGELVLRDVDDFLGDEIDDEDVAGSTLLRGERDAASIGRKVRRFRIVDHAHLDALQSPLVRDVLNDQRPRLFGAHEIGEVVAVP